MGPNVKVVFEGDPPQKLPKFIAGRVWNWLNCKERDWYYPMAMMGQFYRTNDLVNYLTKLKFENPNSLEGVMMCNIMRHKPLMIWFERSKVIELAVNRVHNVATKNRFGNINTKILNDLILSGQRIKIEPLLELSGSINRYFNVDFVYEGLNV